MKKGYKNEKGAVTILVTVTILFMIVFLISAYLLASNKAKTQADILEETKRIYQVGDMALVYNSFFGKNVVPIYTIEQLSKVGSGEKIAIDEENGRIYIFSTDATYVLMNNLEFDYGDITGTWDAAGDWTPIGKQYELGQLTGKLEGNFKTITVAGNNAWGTSYAFNMENEYKYNNDAKPGEVVTGGHKKYKNATIPEGFKVSEIPAEQDIETGLVIIGPDGSEFVWMPIENPIDMYIPNAVSTGNHAGRLYAIASANNFDSNLTGQTYTADAGFREPDIARDSGGYNRFDNLYSNYTAVGITGVGSVTPANDFKGVLQGEFNEMIASVITYGGFYIGRYETSLSGTGVAQSKKNENAMTTVNWYYMYQKQKTMYASLTSVESGMIWGCQFDQIMKFVENNTNLNIKDSRNWGNYSDSISPANVAGYGSKKKTGSSEYWKACNIYDIAGNVMEWTKENEGLYARGLRRWMG